MKLTLRKAARLRTAIETRLSSMSFRGLLPISYGQELKLDAEVKAARAKLKKDLATADALEAVLLHLRIQIGIANETTEINRKLTNRALLSRVRARQVALSECQEFDQSKAENRLALAKKRTESNVYGGDDNVEVDFLDAEMIADFRDAAVRTRRYITAIDDDIARINGTYEIEMTPEQHNLLLAEGIV